MAVVANFSLGSICSPRQKNQRAFVDLYFDAVLSFGAINRHPDFNAVRYFEHDVIKIDGDLFVAVKKPSAEYPHFASSVTCGDRFCSASHSRMTVRALGRSSLRGSAIAATDAPMKAHVCGDTRGQLFSHDVLAGFADIHGYFSWGWWLGRDTADAILDTTVDILRFDIFSDG